VLVAIILNVPINAIILRLIDVPDFSRLEVLNGVMLMILSTTLTLLAGLIPSGIAARRDPVVALRTE
jgi:putative ABC transport system permease protein